MFKNRQTFLIMVFTIIFALSVFAQAQTTAFNFQGRLNDGSFPANGHYDLEFRLFDAIVGGNQIGSTISKPNLTLVNGVFSTPLDFGSTAFDGSDRFIEISLRPTSGGSNSPNAFVILGPRQQILSVPYTIRSLRATNADNADNADKLGGFIPSLYVRQDESQNVSVHDLGITGESAIAGNLKVNGNVAIGTLTIDPSRKLYVQGDAKITGLTFLNGDTVISGNSAIDGTANVGGGLYVGGNVKQSLTSYGLPKAMLKINGDGTILYCYNSVTGTSSSNCGYTVDHFTSGGYGIDFGFGTDASFVQVSVEYDRGNSDAFGANYSTSIYANHLDVFTFRFSLNTSFANPNNLKPQSPQYSRTVEYIDRPFVIILY